MGIRFYNRNGVQYLSLWEWLNDLDDKGEAELGRVAFTRYGPHYTSTIWAGQNLTPGTWEPRIYETAVFRYGKPIFVRNWTTIEYALKMHDYVAEGMMRLVDKMEEQYPLKAITAG